MTPSVSRAASTAGTARAPLSVRARSARADNGARAVPAVLGALEAEGGKVATVTVSRPSLDDVYLRYVGRSFSEADKEVPR